MIELLKVIICDNCSSAIDYLDGNLSDKEIKKTIKKKGAIVEGKRIFCSNECKKQYKNLMKKMDRWAKQILKETNNEKRS